jgi:hypothetical protein
MRIGISINSAYRVDNPRLGAQYMIERARTARQADLDSLFVGDHHVTPTPYYQNTPMLGRLLAEWHNKPVGALYLLPLWHPVLLAEQIATLAAIAPGRFIMQCGLGWEPEQSAGMGVDIKLRAAMFEASLDGYAKIMGWRGGQRRSVLEHSERTNSAAADTENRSVGRCRCTGRPQSNCPYGRWLVGVTELRTRRRSTAVEPISSGLCRI